VIALTVLAGGYWYYRAETEGVRQQQYQAIAAVGELKASQIQQWRKDRLADVTLTAKNPFLTRAVGGARDVATSAVRAELQSYVDAKAAAYGYSDALLFGLDGKLLVAARNDAVDAATQRAVASVLARGEAELSDLFRAADGRVHLDAIAVMRNAEGASVAVVVLRCEVGTYLYPLIHSWPTPSRSGETLLVQRVGEDVEYLNDLRHRARTALALRTPLTRTDVPAVEAVLGKHGMFQGRDYRGIEVLADLRQIPGSPWFMVVKMDTAEIFAEARYRADLIAIIVGCLILLAASSAAAVYRHRRAMLFRDLYESERQQREVQQAFRTTLYSIGDAVIAADTEGRVREMNPVAERLTGWTELEARGRPLEEVFRIVDETTRAPAGNPMHAVLRDGLVVRLANHTLLIARDGAERPIADSAAPIRDDGGVVSGAVLVFSDQTAHRTAARALCASVERFELADRATFRAIWDVDLRTDQLWWNDNLRALFGYQAEELELEPGLEFWTGHIHPEDLERVNAGLLAALDSDREFWSDAYRFRHKDGAYATVEDRGYIVRDADGHPTRIIGAMRDVTEQRRAEAALL
jgi:PAS domain S-box-containing protein